jgi:hypothetical protein
MSLEINKSQKGGMFGIVKGMLGFNRRGLGGINGQGLGRSTKSLIAQLKQCQRRSGARGKELLLEYYISLQII